MPSSMDNERLTPALVQQPTGVPGLDTVLNGGLVRGGVYLVLGQPGTGKTTIGNQLAFKHAAQGGRSLYVTVLSETHSKMLSHLSAFDFLDFDQVGRAVQYVSVYDELNDRGLGGVIDVLRRSVREQGHSLLVIDGSRLFETAADSTVEYNRFISDIGTQLSALNCTTVLLSTYHGDPVDNVTGMFVDGIFVLENKSFGLRDVRYIHPLKVRGVGHLDGRHEFTISGSGLEVYARLEAALERSSPLPSFGSYDERVSTGITGLDDMLHGGLLPGSVSTVWGPPGVGKTLTGVSFVVAGAQRGEPGMISSFHETPEMLSLMARGIGLEFDRFLQSGLITVNSYLAPETPLDQWAWHVLESIKNTQSRRLFIDGVSDVSRLAIVEGRLPGFFKTFNRSLREIGVTTLVTAETPEMNVGTLIAPSPDLATSSDAVVFLRYIESGPRLHHLVSIPKIRASGHEREARQFEITSNGIHVFANGDSAAELLTGSNPMNIQAQTTIRDRATQGETG